MSDLLRWYVVEAREGAIREALLTLALHFSTKCPAYEVWAPFDSRRSPDRSRSGRPRADVRTPRFGRFVFIRCAMTDSLARAIRECAGVIDMLRCAGTEKLSSIPDEHIEHLRAAGPRSATENPYVAGDVVQLVEGPFAGLSAKVERVDKRGVVSIALELLGRPTPIVVEVGHVKMVQPAKSRSILGVHRSAPREKSEARRLQRNGAKSAA